ncbi:MAG: EutN/CcmL family microcompartment protein [bacterium]|jgi:ethanolamine utilization protein EutN|nr:ethanolamine utilization protein EutN [Planctomycetota bacterium]HIL51983.1 ethanolamine utilization protein EutN [Planctomycetota bacterium]
MHICTVVGNLWATQKEASLTGLPLLVVRPFTSGTEQTAETMVAVDTQGARLGERVLVVHGRAARHAIGRGHDIGFQTAIVAIVDSMELEGGRRVGQTAAEDSKIGTY